jgi:integrase/recombinase XerC
MSGEKSDLPPDRRQIEATFVEKREKQVGKNWEENVFQGIPVGADEAGLLDTFLKAHDFAKGTRRGFVLDLRKFAKWFTEANRERFVVSRVTTRDITDFRDHLRREKG